MLGAAFVIGLVLYLGGAFAQYGYPSPLNQTPGGGQITATVTYAGQGESASLPLKGTVVSALNATKLQGLTVEMYKFNPTSGLWDLKSSATTSSTAGSLGDFDSGQVQFTTGDIVFIHVVEGSATSPVVKVVDFWKQVPVPAKVTDLTTHGIGAIEVYTTVSAASYITPTLFKSDMTAIGTSNGAVTTLDISDATTNQQAILVLAVSQTYSSFGGTITIPATSKGHLARELTSIVYVEFNRTDVSFKSGGWAKATASSASYLRYVRAIDRLQTDSTQPDTMTVQLWFDTSGITAATPVKITIGWVDGQTMEDAKNGISYAGAGSDEGYNYADTANFYVTSQA